jgi:hypothetical protein
VVLSSQQISQQVMAQNAMFQQQAAYAQQLSYPMQAAMHPGGPPPPPPPPPPISLTQVGGSTSGIYGEQLAMRMAQTAQTGAGMGATVAGMGTALLPLGLAGGMAAAAPVMAAGAAIDFYGGQFSRGMTEQAALNSTLRNNFRHFGGQGGMGRGFSQSQMGGIGSVVSQELRSNVFTNAGEMNSLIAGGAEAGMFTGVQDAKAFGDKFRKMLNTLKEVQRELGGTLTDALAFVRSAKQSGIFQATDRVNFAGELRGAEAASGLSRDQLMGLGQQGAMMSRQVGGYGRQGAYGAVRTASQLGAAVRTGAINEELLSEATGGLTGADAVQSMTMRLMQHTAQFSRRPMGRYSIFGMSNEEGTGLDEGQLARHLTGDISTGDVSRRAHRRVAGMGRARAMNQEGVLRGALLEQGGLAGQIGMMRLMVGDRVMDQSDALASQVIQRRMRVSRPEAELMMSLMRNQGNIAEQESADRVSAGRQQALQTEHQQNRGVDQYMRHLVHGLEEASGAMAVREMGRSFLTRISTMVERATNNLIGAAETQLTSGDRQALNRLSLGQASQEDIQRLSIGRQGSTGMTGEQLLTSRGMLETGLSQGELLARRGVRIAGMTEGQARDAVDRAQRARAGDVSALEDGGLRDLQHMRGNSAQMDEMLARARMRGGDDFYQHMRLQGRQLDANAVDVWMASQGYSQGDNRTVRRSALMGRRQEGGGVTGMLRELGQMAGLISGDPEVLQTADDRRIDFISRGGHAANALEERIERTRTPGAMRDEARAQEIQRGLLRRRGYSTDDVEASIARRSTQEDNVNLSDLQHLRSQRPEDIRAVAESDTFRRRMQRIEGMDGNVEDITAEFSLMRAEANRMQDPRQRDAYNAMITQMQHNVETNRRPGSNRSHVGREFSAFRIDEERAAAVREELQNMAVDYGAMGDGLRGLVSNPDARDDEGNLDVEGQGGNEVAAELRRRMGMMREMLRADEPDIEGFNREAADLGMYLASEDPNSDAYRATARELGRTETGRQQLMRGANLRQKARDLSGQGRRGSAGAAEGAFNMVTGGMLSEMNLTVDGRNLSERNRAQVLQRIFTESHRGGRHAERAEDVIRQMSAQMERAGVEGAEGLLETFRMRSARGRGERSALNEDEALQMASDLSQNADLQRIQREAVTRRAEAQNPVGAETNNILRRIETRLGNMQAPAGLPAAETPGDANMSTASGPARAPTR